MSKNSLPPANKAQALETHWENGNREYVLNELASLPAKEKMAVAAYLTHYLGHSRDPSLESAFLRALERSADE